MARPKIYVCRPLPEKALALLRGRTEMRLWEQNEIPPPREVLLREVADIDGLLSLATARRVGEADKYTRANLWRSWEPMLFLAQDVHGATLGLVGLGRIGSAVARRAKGFNMRILYHDVIRREDLEGELGIEFRPFEEVLREAD